MAYEIKNKIRGRSVIRFVGAGTQAITLANLAANSNETVTDIKIEKVIWSTSGDITVQRGGTTVLSLFTCGEMNLAAGGFVLDNAATANLTVVITTGGTCIIEVAKTATYTTSLDVNPL